MLNPVEGRRPGVPPSCGQPRPHGDNCGRRPVERRLTTVDTAVRRRRDRSRCMAPIGSDNAVRDHVDLPAMTPEVAAALTPTLVGATAVAALLLVVLAYESVEAVDIIVHEGGHMVVGSLVGRRVRHFEIEPAGTAVTRFSLPSPWGPARIISAVAGYPAV